MKTTVDRWPSYLLDYLAPFLSLDDVHSLTRTCKEFSANRLSMLVISASTDPGAALEWALYKKQPQFAIKVLKKYAGKFNVQKCVCDECSGEHKLAEHTSEDYAEKSYLSLSLDLIKGSESQMLELCGAFFEAGAIPECDHLGYDPSLSCALQKVYHPKVAAIFIDRYKSLQRADSPKGGSRESIYGRGVSRFVTIPNLLKSYLVVDGSLDVIDALPKMAYFAVTLGISESVEILWDFISNIPFDKRVAQAVKGFLAGALLVGSLENAERALSYSRMTWSSQDLTDSVVSCNKFWDPEDREHVRGTSFEELLSIFTKMIHCGLSIRPTVLCYTLCHQNLEGLSRGLLSWHLLQLMSPETNLGENIHHSGKFIDFDCCERRCLGTAISFGEGLIVLWMHLPKKRRPTEFLEHILNSGSCRKIDLAVQYAIDNMEQDILEILLQGAHSMKYDTEQLRISEARPKSKIYENPDFLQFLASRKVPLKVRSTDLLEYMLDNGSIDGIRAVIAAGLYSNASIMAELTARPTGFAFKCRFPSFNAGRDDILRLLLENGCFTSDFDYSLLCSNTSLQFFEPLIEFGIDIMEELPKHDLPVEIKITARGDRNLRMISILEKLTTMDSSKLFDPWIVGQALQVQHLPLLHRMLDSGVVFSSYRYRRTENKVIKEDSLEDHSLFFLMAVLYNDADEQIAEFLHQNGCGFVRIDRIALATSEELRATAFSRRKEIVRIILNAGFSPTVQDILYLVNKRDAERLEIIMEFTRFHVFIDDVLFLRLLDRRTKDTSNVRKDANTTLNNPSAGRLRIAKLFLRLRKDELNLSDLLLAALFEQDKPITYLLLCAGADATEYPGFKSDFLMPLIEKAEMRKYSGIAAPLY